MRYRDRIRELEERKEHEEWRKRTQQAQEELLALVRDAQRSGNVVVYYRFSDAKDCEKRLGKATHYGDGTSRGKECGISKTSVASRVLEAFAGMRDRLRLWHHTQ